MSEYRILSGFKELAAILRVSEKTVQRHVHALPVKRLGNRIYALESDLIDWVQDNRQDKDRRSKYTYRSK